SIFSIPSLVRRSLTVNLADENKRSTDVLDAGIAKIRLATAAKV
ncbi:unnamed protein product, partial [Rotaria magnacalcarata]